jgi:uncharacterized Fe-S cluster-containing protein
MVEAELFHMQDLIDTRSQSKSQEGVDLVALIKSYNKQLSKGTLEELDEIQDFIKDVIMQQKIDSGEFKVVRLDPSWRL